MTWADKIITNEALAEFSKGEPGDELASRVEALIRHQRRSWPLLREGYESLEKARTKRINLPGTDRSEVVIQLNPRRIRSTAASVDKASVDARQCFLCAESLPPEEKGIAYGDDLIIMCNPYPVLDRHLSIIHRRHVPQKIEGNVESLLDLSRDLGADYFALYNGPQCGASAPDHLHFQACSRGLLPIEDDLRTVAGARAPEPVEPVVALKGCGRSVVVFRGGEPGPLARYVYRALEGLASRVPEPAGLASSNPSDGAKPEPMINMIVTHEAGAWTVFLFPRARHRPARFYAEGDQRLTISPGAIDMAGVVVMPDSEQFRRITSRQVQEIFSEVCLDERSVDAVLSKFLL